MAKGGEIKASLPVRRSPGAAAVVEAAGAAVEEEGAAGAAGADRARHARRRALIRAAPPMSVGEPRRAGVYSDPGATGRAGVAPGISRVLR